LVSILLLSLKFGVDKDCDRRAAALDTEWAPTGNPANPAREIGKGADTIGAGASDDKPCCGRSMFGVGLSDLVGRSFEGSRVLMADVFDEGQDGGNDKGEVASDWLAGM